MDNTLEYLYNFKNGKHDDAKLVQRRESAKQIMNIIREKKIKQDYDVKRFKAKWTDYFNSNH